MSGLQTVEVLPNDQVANLDRSSCRCAISRISGSGWTGGAEPGESLGRQLFQGSDHQHRPVTSQVNLLRDGMLSRRYDGHDWNFSARSQSYPDPAGSAGTDRHPLPPRPDAAECAKWRNICPAVDLALNSELVGFPIHPAQRQALQLVPQRQPAADPALRYITPKIGMHRHQLQLATTTSPRCRISTRTLPIFSVDSGLYFERDMQLLGSNYQQTLEPRLYYFTCPTATKAGCPCSIRAWRISHSPDIHRKPLCRGRPNQRCQPGHAGLDFPLLDRKPAWSGCAAHRPALLLQGAASHAGRQRRPHRQIFRHAGLIRRPDGAILECRHWRAVQHRPAAIAENRHCRSPAAI